MADKKNENGDRDLHEYGIIFLSGVIGESAAESVCRQIIEHNVKGDVDQIQIVINSPGGSCPAGFAIIDLMEWSRIPIYTTGVGMIASMALLVFMTGEAGHRVVTPRTSILSHRFYSMAAGNHSQLLAGRKEQDLEHQRIVDHYLRYSSIPTREELERTLLRDVDTWLSPDEAVQCGLVDVVESLRRRHGDSRQ